jgi:ATP-dependent HslUV protease ATP-binding subunit HslU
MAKRHLTPRETVEALDKYIVGQDDAKRAVAIALRNRYRRSQLDDALREDITPKNILMIGPTGVGKTEIARRLAKLVEAPFVKVEATKFTEVGYVGRDVDSIVRDLIESAVRMVKERMMREVELEAAAGAEEKLLDALLDAETEAPRPAPSAIEQLLGSTRQNTMPPEERERRRTRREELRDQLQRGELEGVQVEIEVEETSATENIPGTDINMSDVLGSILPKKKKLRRVSVVEARRLLQMEEAQKLIDIDAATGEAVKLAEQDGIVFIDEIDKIAGRSQSGSGPDVSREGVQRDILPIVEGSTVNTKYGPVRTDHMLFIAAGAFHVAKVTDLIPELQGRFPIQVNLKPLTREDFRRILTQPQNAVLTQYKALLGVEGVSLAITDDALECLADIAVRVNDRQENIGARRLHTVMEQLLEDVSFAAGENGPEDVTIDRAYVETHLREALREDNVRNQIF